MDAFPIYFDKAMINIWLNTPNETKDIPEGIEVFLILLRSTLGMTDSH